MVMNKLDRLFDRVSTLPNQQWPSFDLDGLHDEGPLLSDRDLENSDLTSVEDFENAVAKSPFLEAVKPF